MISVPGKTKLSDHLFAYAFGRILAQRFNYALRAAPMINLPGTAARVDGQEYLNTTRRWVGHWPMEESTGRALEKGELFVAPGYPVSLIGGFQRFELFADHREEIRNDWFAVPNRWNQRSAEELVICLDSSVEFGESAFEKMEARSMAREAVEECVRLARTVPHRTLHVLYHGERDSIPAEVAALKPEVMVPESHWDELQFLASFQKIAIRQDALQWWGAFLGAAREIHFPKTKRGPWSQPNRARLAHESWWYGIDLKVLDDPRYIYATEDSAVAA